MGAARLGSLARDRRARPPLPAEQRRLGLAERRQATERYGRFGRLLRRSGPYWQNTPTIRHKRCGLYPYNGRFCQVVLSGGANRSGRSEEATLTSEHGRRVPLRTELPLGSQPNRQLRKAVGLRVFPSFGLRESVPAPNGLPNSNLESYSQERAISGGSVEKLILASGQCRASNGGAACAPYAPLYTDTCCMVLRCK